MNVLEIHWSSTSCTEMVARGSIRGFGDVVRILGSEAGERDYCMERGGDWCGGDRGWRKFWVKTSL